MVVIVIIQMKCSSTNSLIKLKHFMKNFSMKASYLIKFSKAITIYAKQSCHFCCQPSYCSYLQQVEPLFILHGVLPPSLCSNMSSQGSLALES